MLKTFTPQPRPVSLLHRLLASDGIVLIACIVAIPTALWFA
ncbi:MAG: hypothetical protein RI906_1563 [Pseudomonadota bacterium]|jgi:hypothetical protein